MRRIATMTDLLSPRSRFLRTQPTRAKCLTRALWDHGRVTLFGKGVQGMPQHYANQFGSVLPPRSVTPPPPPPPDNSGTIALLQQWAREDATGDPAKIAEAENWIPARSDS